jgi:hypothetical protein
LLPTREGDNLLLQLRQVLPLLLPCWLREAVYLMLPRLLGLLLRP